MNNNTYQIETVNDWKRIEQVLLLFNTSFPRLLSERVGSLEQYARKLADNAVVDVVSMEDKIIGFVAFYCNDVLTKRAFLTQIAVVDDYKGQNIGNILLELCVEKVKKNGMKKLICEVDDDNVAALKFYDKNGFTNVVKASECSLFLEKIL